MANPLPNEPEIYKKINKNKLTIPFDIWELIENHIGNDVHIIQFIAGSHVGGDDPEVIPVEDGKKIIAQCDEIREFLMKIRKVAEENPQNW